MKKRAIVFGLGGHYFFYRAKLRDCFDIVALTDNDAGARDHLRSKEQVKIIEPGDIKNDEFDVVIITTKTESYVGAIIQQLRELDIKDDKIFVLSENLEKIGVKHVTEAYAKEVIENHKRKYGVNDSVNANCPFVSQLARRLDIEAHSKMLKELTGKCKHEKYHRKIWEWVYISQVLREHSMLEPRKKGIGFAVGGEPLPALFAKYGVSVLATDIGSDHYTADSWAQTNQHSADLKSLEHPEICDNRIFYENTIFRHVDMSNIPEDLGGFDFCWSSCALEHLWDVKQGKDFILNTLKLLKPGGVSVHTTEFNLSSENSADIHYNNVFGRACFEALRNDVIKLGHEFSPFDFRLGSHPDEDFVYDWSEEKAGPHFKVVIGDQIATSMGLIIVKGKCADNVNG